MKPYQIFLIRHGNSLSNAQGSTNLKDPDVPLTELGKRQAKEAGMFLKRYFKEQNIDPTSCLYYTSHYLRAEDTMQHIIANLDNSISYLSEPIIREREYGLFDGLDKSEYQKITPDYGTYRNFEERFFQRAPEGESVQDVYERTGEFIHHLLSAPNFSSTPIVIISHSEAIGCMLMHLLGKDLYWYYRTPSPNNAEIIHLISPCGIYFDKEILFTPPQY